LVSYIIQPNDLAGLGSTSSQSTPPDYVSIQQPSPPREDNKSQDLLLRKKVSIVVTTRNRPLELSRCLESLSEDIGSGSELVVVDDCSTVDYSGVRLPEGAIYARNASRRFLSESRNIGAKLATREYLLYVDDDNSVDRGALRQLARLLDGSAAVGVASPVALTQDGRVWYAGGTISFLTGLTVFDFRGQPLSALPIRPMNTQLFHNCFMIRSALLSSIDGFDSRRFPMYLAEADASERLRRRGYKIVVDPRAVVVHGIESGGVKSLMRNIHITEPVRAYYVGRNRVLLMRLYSGSSRYVIFITVFQPVIAFIHLVTILASARRSNYRWTQLMDAYVRGLLDAVLGKVRFGSTHTRFPVNSDLLE
jgi:GT2 family glycosyltransferase